MRIKNLLVLLALLAVPNLASACFNNNPIDRTVSLIGYILFAIFFLLLAVVAFKSIRAKKLYEGKLRNFLFLFLTAYILTAGFHTYRNYLEIKEINECEKNCTSEKECFCNSLCN